MFTLQNVPFNLRQKFEYWIENIVIQTELKQLKFEYEFERNIPLTLESDAYKIQNMILNLVGNSIKHTDQGFIKVKFSMFEEDYHLT